MAQPAANSQVNPLFRSILAAFVARPAAELDKVEPAPDPDDDWHDDPDSYYPAVRY